MRPFNVFFLKLLLLHLSFTRIATTGDKLKKRGETFNRMHLTIKFRSRNNSESATHFFAFFCPVENEIAIHFETFQVLFLFNSCFVV